MSKKRGNTRQNILDETHKLVNQYGFAGTSIDKIIDNSGITKGAFFYHFKSKNDLARTLIEEYAKSDQLELDHVISMQKEKEDPLEGLFYALDHMIDAMGKNKNPHEGCLYASYSYEPSQFTDDVRQVISDSLEKWTTEFEAIFKEVLKTYKTTIKVDIHSLAESFGVLSEGAFIYEKTFQRPGVTAGQIQHFRNYLKFLFVKKS